jgi:hypothetical protein
MKTNTTKQVQALQYEKAASLKTGVLLKALYKRYDADLWIFSTFVCLAYIVLTKV